MTTKNHKKWHSAYIQILHNTCCDVLKFDIKEFMKPKHIEARIVEGLLAPQSGAHRIASHRDFHPNPTQTHPIHL